MSVIDNASSGMARAQAMIAAVASSVARRGPTNFGYRRSDVFTLQGGFSPTPGDSSGADLAGQITDLSQATILYDANAAVMRTADQMSGVLLNMLDTGDTEGEEVPQPANHDTSPELELDESAQNHSIEAVA